MLAISGDSFAFIIAAKRAGGPLRFGLSDVTGMSIGASILKSERVFKGGVSLPKEPLDGELLKERGFFSFPILHNHGSYDASLPQEDPQTRQGLQRKTEELLYGCRSQRDQGAVESVRVISSAVMSRYVGRKLKQRDMRKLWIMRINVGLVFVAAEYRLLRVSSGPHTSTLFTMKHSRESCLIERCSLSSLLL